MVRNSSNITTNTVTPSVISSAHDNQTATCTASNSTTNTAAPQPTPQTSSSVQQTRVNDALDNAAFHLVSPKQLMPYPRIEKRTRRVRRRGKAAIIPAPPYKAELEERQNNKKQKPNKKHWKKQIKEPTKLTKKWAHLAAQEWKITTMKLSISALDTLLFREVRQEDDWIASCLSSGGVIEIQEKYFPVIEHEVVGFGFTVNVSTYTCSPTNKFELSALPHPAGFRIRDLGSISPRFGARDNLRPGEI
ncbi:hypothetical protein WA026_003862 [Henosepilachna vigintioctopunctata]|uniref:Uncharacterized protein n=1 Tax=Henosepilachna vigintioctopunctata TaxID=420089 RepID=A0AAW1UH49_9CUCU